MRKFKEFVISQEAGIILINPYWLEHLLNLFYQGYIGEVSDEINDTIMNTIKTIKNIGYGVVVREFDEKHLDEEIIKRGIIERLK